VHAELDPASYPANIKISDAQMNSLPLHRHGWHGDWNYTLPPAPPAQPLPPPRLPVSQNAPTGHTQP